LRLKADGPGREVAWKEFHSVYAPIIAGFARKLGAPPREIPDLVQEVLVGFFSACPNFVYDPARGRFRGYLKVCTWRVFQRLQGTRRFDGRQVISIADNDIAVEHEWNDVWETEKLHRALEMVRKRYETRPKKARTFQAFNLYALVGRPADEVAAELSMPVLSVQQAKTRISRAIKIAMEELDETIG
jgi:DNA-directed RNA polymerase specialized sigma24 family protein